MLFSRNPGESYSPVKLSDGEKAVLYYFGAAMYAPREPRYLSTARDSSSIRA